MSDPFRREESVRSAMEFLNGCIDATDATDPEVWIEALYRLAHTMQRDITRTKFENITRLFDGHDIDGRGTE